MSFINETSHIYFVVLLLNAIFFIPQAIHIIKNKSAQGVSLIAFGGFLLIQIFLVLHASVYKNYLLMSGCLLGIIGSGLVIFLVIFYREKKHDDFSLEKIFEQLPGHIYWKDSNYRLVGCNTKNSQNFNFSSVEEAIGKTDYDFFSKDIADKVRAIDAKVIIEGIDQVAEEIFIREDGAKVVYLSHKKPLKNREGHIVGLVGFSMDVTFSKKEVLDKLAILDNIIAVMPGNVYWMDKKGVYLGCNVNEAKSFGLNSRKDIIGKRKIDISGFSIPEILNKNNYRVLENGENILVEESVIQQDGSQAIFLTSKVPLRDSDNNIIGLIGISFDITEKKKVEQELVKAKETAEASDRAKTEFFVSMSHDVKTPLSGIIGMADLMTQNSSEQVRQGAKLIYSCGMQLLGFFNSCLEISRLEMLDWSIHNEVFSLKQILHEMEALFSPTAQVKKLELTVQVDPALPSTVAGSRASIYCILLNLIGNAVKFTAYGRIDVQVFLSEALSPDEIYVCFEVKDTGIGIPGDKLGTIFDKIGHLTSVYQGKIKTGGCGLYLVGQYVKRINGRVRVDSVLGEGSIFQVFLPLKIADEKAMIEDDAKSCTSENLELAIADLPSDQAGVVKIEEISVKESAVHILLVEDNSLIQHVTETLLAESGFVVDVAATGVEAIEKFISKKYDLVYMDIGLPDQDGYIITQALRAHEKSIGKIDCVPVVALTAHSSVDVELFCARAGMQGIVSKPLTREQAGVIWERYGLGKEQDVIGLTVIQAAKLAPPENQIIDLDETVTLLGTREYALELLTLWYEMLTHRFLPVLTSLVKSRDEQSLRHELHTMLGSLCYVKTPLLNQAALELQAAIRTDPANIEFAYQHLLDEAQRFIEYYQKKYG